jgi:AcrR family transcriptional regulator
MTTTGRRPGRPLEPVSRDTLMSAAIRVFAREGFAAARLADIAREAGITKGALAYHFATKEALYLEVMGEITEGFRAFMQGALAGRGSWLERLDGLGAAVVRVLGTQPELARLILRELVDCGPYLAGPGEKVVGELLDAIAAFLAQGLPPERDARQLAGTIVALHFGWFGARGLSAPLVGDPTAPVEIERRVEAVLDQVRWLCGAPPRPCASR